MWAIEYGYKPLSGGTDGEVAELKKIAARCGEPELAYATDEDTRGIDPDPLSNRFDMGKDPIAYAKMRAAIDQRAMADRCSRNRPRTAKDIRKLVRRLACCWPITAGRCTSRRATSAACTSAALTRATRTRRRRSSWWNRPSSANRWTWSKSKYSATSRSSFRPSCIATWLPAAGRTGVRHAAADRLSGARSDCHVAGPDSPAIALVADARTAARHRVAIPRRPGRPDHAGAVGNAEQRRSSRGRQMPAGEYTNRKPAISSLRRNLQRSYLKRCRAGHGPHPGSARLPNRGLCRARRPGRPDRQATQERRSWTPTARPTWKNRPAEFTGCSRARLTSPELWAILAR